MSELQGAGSRPSLRSDVLTAPNLITVVRLLCLPVYLWLLFGRDDRVAAALLLGLLGATDWVDGYVARRFGQVSELGKMLDPTADRLLFLVGVGAIVVDGAAPLWFSWAVLAREAVFGGTVAVLTLFFGMSRFDVTWWGKLATFLLMFAFPGYLMGSSDITLAPAFTVAATIIGIPGLVISYATAVAYIPIIRAHLHKGRRERVA